MTFVADTLFLCGSWASCYIHVPCSGLHKTTTQTLGYAPLFVMLLVKGLNAIFMYTLNGNWVTIDMEENFSAKTSYSLLWKFEKTVTCKRDPEPRDRDETETLGKCVSRPSRDRDVEAETTSLGHGLDLSRSRDVIGHVTIRFPTPHFL